MKTLRLSALFLAVFLLNQVAFTQVNVLVAYYSRDGHTQALAETVAQGAASVEGTTVKLRSISEIEPSDLLEAQAIIVGSPVYNAHPAPEVMSFIQGWPFEGSPMKDKIGAAFATGGGISAGEELTQLSILHSMLIFGMVIVGGPKWDQAFGASAVTGEHPFVTENEGTIADYFAQKGYLLGERVAVITQRLNKPAKSKTEIYKEMFD